MKRDNFFTVAEQNIMHHFVNYKVQELNWFRCLFRTLGEAWTQLKKSLHDEAEVHLKFSNKVMSAKGFRCLTFRAD